LEQEYKVAKKYEKFKISSFLQFQLCIDQIDEVRLLKMQHLHSVLLLFPQGTHTHEFTYFHLNAHPPYCKTLDTIYADVLCLAGNFSVDLLQKLPDPYRKALAGVRFIFMRSGSTRDCKSRDLGPRGTPGSELSPIFMCFGAPSLCCCVYAERRVKLLPLRNGGCKICIASKGGAVAM
jgi:hypothetical protein